jgi:hypothetical protein
MSERNSLFFRGLGQICSKCAFLFARYGRLAAVTTVSEKEFESVSPDPNWTAGGPQRRATQAPNKVSAR